MKSAPKGRFFLFQSLIIRVCDRFLILHLAKIILFLSAMRLRLITVLFFSFLVNCSNSHYPENPKYAAIHKLWKFKKDVLYADTSVILHFKDYQTTYLDLRSKTSITFSRDNGRSFTSDYYIEGDTIVGQYHNTRGKYAIVEFSNSKLIIVKLPDNGGGLNKANRKLIEIVFEASN